ncbi:enoyl-CoA hydratase/isomerase family protein [Paracoccus sp. SCSIO 75233]|uniref:enoyl-CoA hydratase/isomerase family protein n=1 Tax=Paracoccus sp. SCSIO 75233 TaxID=3017782 RepID=UPI0022F04C22|nr:enoyl-CoA hydratase/isomerase family protein [Paracoccus sp. SCSIO 75233]WBU52562.1 enoyl-CoA hydratase/isomerase family protein [Paracoccus sp. SCSIO 75233]
MADMTIRKQGRAGRMTFNRPQALNALDHDMVKAIHAALDDWRDDAEVALVIIDAEGEKAFCAGGDIAAVYRAGLAGDHSVGQRFFFDEYRMNAAIADYPKPILAFMQGFVMGGGVGVGGHAGHRIVGDSTRIAMPESGIGLIPDVGGTWLLSRAPDHIGEYLALTAGRMGPGDAIHAGFADLYIPEQEWPGLIDQLCETGDTDFLAGQTPPEAPLADADLSAFAGADLADIISTLEAQGNEDALKPIRRNSPLSMAAGLRMVRAARNDARIQDSLAREFRFTYRATQHGDFLEGVRAQIIDKDRNPQWSADASEQGVEAMLAPLGDDELQFD